MVFCRGNVNFETVAVMYCVHFITLTLPHGKKTKTKATKNKNKTKQTKQKNQEQKSNV
jgi:hypothetical protein